MKTPKNLHSIAIPFFSQANWLIAKASMEDGHTFHDSYAQFVQRVVEAELKLTREGKATERIDIQPQAFIDWCRRGGRQINAQGRAEFAALMAAQADRSMNA